MLKKKIDHGYYREKECQYLATILTQDNEVTTEIKHRIIMANKTSYGLKKQLNWPTLKSQTERTSYKSLIRPILIYGNECWSFQRRV